MLNTKKRAVNLASILLCFLLLLMGILPIHAVEVPVIATYVEATGTNRYGYVWPIDGPVSDRYMSQAFKYAGNAGNTDHNAIDIAAATGTEIVATANGTVVCSSTASASASHTCSACGFSGAGYHVIIKHTDGYYSIYAHMSSVSVANGNTVTAGQGIGAVGSTGYSTGSHLHFAIYQNANGYISYIDPLAKLTPFADVYAKNITSSNATLHADFGVMGIPFSAEGFYIGTDKTSLTKITDSKGTGYNYIGNQIQNIYFNLNEYYGRLTSGTKYYFQFWLNHNGIEYKSDLYSFVAGDANSSASEENAVVAPAVSVTYSSYDEKHSIGTDNAVLAGIANITNATNLEVDMGGILLYDYKGTQIASKTEDTTNISTFYGENFVKIWYDVKNTVGYTLSAGTTYQYRFFIEIYGTKYYSPLLSFTTNGTHTHVWDNGSVTREATCSQSGIMTFACSMCDQTKEETIPATGNHTSGNWQTTKEPTCTQTGIKIKTCTICGKQVESDILPATGNHTPGSWSTTKEATCSTAGTIVQKCDICETQINSETIPATGMHSFGEWNNANAEVHQRICRLCTYSEQSSHHWDNGSLIVAPTENQEGLFLYTCSDCKTTKVEHLDPLPSIDTTAEPEVTQPIIETTKEPEISLPTTETVSREETTMLSESENDPPISVDETDPSSNTIEVTETMPDTTTEQEPLPPTETITSTDPVTVSPSASVSKNEGGFSLSVVIFAILLAGMAGGGIAFLLFQKRIK